MNYFENKVVSVIIPVYNAEKFIGKTLDSVLNQTYQKIEIIIVDDCSIDHSQRIINNYCKIYQNIKYLRLSKNAGVAVARNKGIDMAIGRYIAFLDSDDIWSEYKIEKQVKLMERKNAALSFTAIEIINEDDVVIKGKRNIAEEIDYKYLLKNTLIATSSAVIDRRLSGDFQISVSNKGEDYATWLYLMRHGSKAHGINEALVKYRKHSKSLSSNKLRSMKIVWNVQVKKEKIHVLPATYNTLCFAFNAFKKHYL
jgi:teichuronic acid biosynthesis glycosyltransferase TuaG